MSALPEAPIDERARLTALERFRIDGTAPEQDFDDLTWAYLQRAAGQGVRHAEREPVAAVRHLPPRCPHREPSPSTRAATGILS